MNTQCTPNVFYFEPLSDRQVVARFNGGTITSEGGALLLADVERRTAILQRLADCFTDHRNPDLSVVIGVTASEAGRNGVGQCAVRDDTATVVEDRRVGVGDGSPRVGIAGG